MHVNVASQQLSCKVLCLAVNNIEIRTRARDPPVCVQANARALGRAGAVSAAAGGTTARGRYDATHGINILRS